MKLSPRLCPVSCQYSTAHFNHSSLIIEHIEELCESRPLSGYAYFFFDSRNSNKGLSAYENLLRSLLSQLASRCGGIPGALKDMYQQHHDGRSRPSLKSLGKALQRVIEGFDEVYIMVDSLDECGDRVELLQWIKATIGWEFCKLHLLFTSRPETDIVKHLDPISRVRRVHMAQSSCNMDIRLYLDSRIALIDVWDESIRVLVKTTLIEDADGMCVQNNSSYAPFQLRFGIGSDGWHCR